MSKLIPSVTISRLVSYLRVLVDLEQRRTDYVTSEEIGEASRTSAHQVRKDLVYAGASGTRGRGYTVAILRREIQRLLGLTSVRRVAIVGMGRLGQALVDYPYFQSGNFELLCGFDADPAKVGELKGGFPVYAMRELTQRVEELSLDIAFLTVPVGAAQAVAEELVGAGIKGLLNFAPTVLKLPEHVKVEPVDFVAGLKRLAYYLQADDDAG